MKARAGIAIAAAVSVVAFAVEDPILRAGIIGVCVVGGVACLLHALGIERGK